MILERVLIVVTAVYFAMCVIAAVVWGLLLAHRRRTGTLLPREPRRPAPWGPLGLFVACFLASYAVAGAIDVWLSDNPGRLPQETPSTEDFLWGMWAFSSIVLFGMAAVYSFYWWSGIADRRDLGWPSGWKEWRRDIRLGRIAALAVIGPVYVIQIAVVYGLDMPTSHPLIDAFLREPRLSVAITVGFSVLVAAPIFEELLFRQLMQGWLERLNGDWDHRPQGAVGSGQWAVGSDRCELGVASGEEESGSAGSGDVSETEDDPSQGLLVAPNPPRGRWPIYVSSFLFALVHLGQGGAPIPLFFLALALGYLYQRTHRIVPCIVLHMLFNAFAMALLWVQVALS